jgi:hypothetical protein
MIYLPQLRDQLIAAPAASRRRRRLPAVALLVPTGLLVAAGALAATGVIPIGSSVKTPHWVNRDPHRQTGVPVPAGAGLLALRVADPAGGPPWGMRLVKTSRGLTCMQIGRVVDGKLGVLGRDGAGGDDGRFHPLPAALAGADPFGCVAPDGAGHPFAAYQKHSYASGEVPRRTCADPERHDTKRPACPAADERLLSFGLLGPQGSSISFVDGHSQTVAAPLGAYLAVLPASASSFDGGGDTPMAGFGSVTRVTYRDGSTCPPAPRAGGQCPLAGYVAPRSRLTPAAVRRPLRVDVGRAPKLRHALELRVSFRAPVAISDARSMFMLTGTCAGARNQSLGAGTSRDIRKGALVRIAAPFSDRCRGPLSGRVVLITSSVPGARPGIPAKLLVGRFTHDLPG